MREGHPRSGQRRTSSLGGCNSLTAAGARRMTTRPATSRSCIAVGCPEPSIWPCLWQLNHGQPYGSRIGHEYEKNPSAIWMRIL
jgi:hypothetical protein